MFNFLTLPLVSSSFEFVLIFKQDTNTSDKKSHNLAAVTCDEQPLVLELVFANTKEPKENLKYPKTIPLYIEMDIN